MGPLEIILGILGPLGAISQFGSLGAALSSLTLEQWLIIAGKAAISGPEVYKLLGKLHPALEELGKALEQNLGEQVAATRAQRALPYAKQLEDNYEASVRVEDALNASSRGG